VRRAAAPAVAAVVLVLLGAAGGAGAGSRPVERDFFILAGGDLLVHTPISARALALGGGRYDFRPFFASIRPLVRRAALAICHVEIPLGAGPPSPYPRLNAPAGLAWAIRWAGFDVCDTASNHTLDHGQRGVETTLRALDAAGVRHTGSARGPREARRILLVDVRGITVAFLAYTEHTNGLPLPAPSSVNVLSPVRVAADARRARRLGADLVVVNFHWGPEYAHRPTAFQRALARGLLRHRIVDVIFGQGSHVVQPIRAFSGRFVAYGSGNLISNQSAACCPAETQDGMLVLIRVHAVGHRARVRGIDYVPTRVEHPGYVVLPAGATLRRLARDGERRSPLADELRASFVRTTGSAGRARRIRPIPPALPR
jgi:poly-gamma-glutamate synthesis protein (capsule biosynthesis protein)